jgi:YHS domain-containing protein
MWGLGIFCHGYGSCIASKVWKVFLASGEGGTSMMKDIVCGMEVSEKESEYRSRYEGQMFYFCSDECKTKFDDSPEDFMTAAA